MASPIAQRMFSQGYCDEMKGRECLVAALLIGGKRASATLYKAGRVRAAKDRMAGDISFLPPRLASAGEFENMTEDQ
jgi:hypothetical protein